MQKNEKDEKVDTCMHINDLGYDDCVYAVHGQMMKEQIKCSFEFIFGGGNNSSNTNNAKECTLDDVNGTKAFQDIVYGKT